jgi:ribonucleotide reductase beta subunit family protein with ferritin-like domain
MSSANPLHRAPTQLPPEALEPLENPELHSLAITASECDKSIMKLYTAMTNVYWLPRSIHLELDKDSRGWETLAPNIQHFVKQVLAFFAISDGIVNETLSNDLASRVTLPEARLFYRYQEMMEDIHNLTYNLLIETYVTDKKERREMLNAMIEYPAIAKKIAWLKKWLNAGNVMHQLPQDTRRVVQKLCDSYSNGIAAALHIRPGAAVVADPEIVAMQNLLRSPRVPLARAILVNAIMEGVFFQSSFCSIFWINHVYKGALPGLIKSNEYISRDEGMHTVFGVLMYRRMVHRLPEAEVHAIMREAVEVEASFVHSALPSGLLGMNADMMNQYVQYEADNLLFDLGYARLYNVTKPFDWMGNKEISMRITDFFVDTDVTEYTHGATAGVDGKSSGATPAHLNEDF